ncbi:MAG: thiamine ABC transporter substrate-binding protein [Thermoflexus sp.]|uniref:thiamine ABC transporter substrate-binding protein n=1 Tax=Thermoflexus sp. TaxID=1969742 RepID=UPI0025D058B4|nr:thiamine ABC transporter substrate-binding protein [Thermoflexus sp.]MCS6964059.1 thiamine ABC transporter substrate-binding protein [Thermoflexus sp.]MDW8185201.1 thiamine ABC transporter substrate-binding protein [Anaerolineae bacterium]
MGRGYRWLRGWMLLTALIAACATPTVPPTPTSVPATVTPVPTASPVPATPTPTPSGPRELVLMTHDSFNVSEEVLREFEQRYNVRVQILKAGDAGTALNKAILAKGAPLADVFFGVDNTFFSRAIREDLFEPYRPQGLEEIPQEFLLDPEYRLIPIDYGDVCLNYDKKYFREKGLKPPETLEDLIRPEYRGLLVVQNPATSSPGLAFMLTTIVYFGEERWLDFWRALKANDVKITEGWEDAYFKEFSGAAGSPGTRPIVVSYATSPAAEVYFSEGKLTEPPTGNVLGKNTCFRQIEFAGILKGTKNRDLAERWMDFMISLRFQEDVPMQMFVFPVHPKARLPEFFQKFAEVPPEPARMDPTRIDANRERWIQEWTDLMLR